MNAFAVVASALAAAFAVGWPGGRLAGRLQVAEEVAEKIPFVVRSPFEARAVDAPPILARRAGASASDVSALPVQALGDVRSLTVADIGAGRGRHLARIATAVGDGGRLVATEIGEAGVLGLRDVVAREGLTGVSLVQAQKHDVGLEEGTIDVALLSDVYQFVMLLDGRRGQDKHGFLTSLHRALAPGGEVVVSFVTSARLKQEDTRRELLERTSRDFAAYGFEPGRRWILQGPHWPVLLFEFRSPPDGPAEPRVHMGREIARTMHWAGAEWLVRSEREEEEHSSRMLRSLGVKPFSTVADLGCGNGFHTLELAELVGEQGRVFGVDIQPEMLAMLEARAETRGLGNVEAVRGTALTAPLPTGSCDLVLMADVYHELSHPVPILAEVRRALKPGGRVALLEFRAEDPNVPIKPEHKLSRAQALLEFGAEGFRLAGEMNELPWQHLLFFEVE